MQKGNKRDGDGGRQTALCGRKKAEKQAVRIRWTIIWKDRVETVVVMGDAVLQARYRRILSAQVWPTRLA